MTLETLPVGPLQTNCYVVITDAGKCYIIDPGGDPDKVRASVDSHNVTPDAILLTHGHFDHIGGVPELAEVFGIPVILNEHDHVLYASPVNALPPFPAVDNLPSPVARMDADDAVEVIELPGHSPGSVGYHFPDDRVLFAGDTLFRGSVGRTDLPGGDSTTMLNSIRKLMKLPDDLRVFPGHGPETSIGHERCSNPFLAGIAS